MAAMTRCSHIDDVQVVQVPGPLVGCEECLKVDGSWIHLRMCMTCGNIACCDSSPLRHASAHARETGHPIARSAQPGEHWAWCFVDEVELILPDGMR